MNKLSFSQKNDLVVKYKAKKHFGKDLKLFKKNFPFDRLMNDLARANEWTFERLDGQMLYLLLEKVPIEEILENRLPPAEEKQVSSILPEDDIQTPSPPPVPPTDESPVPSVNQIDETMKSLEERIHALEESNDCNEDEISDLRSELEDKDASIEDLQSKIEALEKKSSDKKKDQTGGIPGDSVGQ